MRVIALAILVTAAFVPGIARLRLRTDGHALVPEQAPAVRLDREVRREFGVRDPLIVMVRTARPEGIYHPATLRLVATLTDSLARLPGLEEGSVTSLATERGDRFRPGTLELRTLLDPVPETPAGLAELRGDVEAIGLLTGTLVSFDGGAAAILVGIPAGGERTALLAAVHRVIAHADTTGHSVAVIGAPVAEALLGNHVLEDLGVPLGTGGAPRLADRPGADLGAIARLRLAIARHVGLLPLSVVVMALVFLVCFRSFTATWLPVSEAGACLVFVFGLMGWTGVPVYLTMAVLPVILVSMGLADEIHVFSRYRQRRAERPGEPVADAVRATLDETSLPVIATALTTAVGFLSFALSPLAPVRAFGIFTAAGIVFCMVWTLTVIPALLVRLPAPRVRPCAGAPFPAGPDTGAGAGASAGAVGAAAGRGWSRRLAALSRRPMWTLGLAALALALCPFGIRRLVVQDSWIGGFAPESTFRRDTEDFNRRFHGVHRLLLVLDTGHVAAGGSIVPLEMDLNEYRFPGDLVSDPATLVGCAIAIGRRGEPANRAWTSTITSAMRRDGRIVVATPPVHGSPLFLFTPAPDETLEYSIRSQRLALPEVLRQIEDLERFVGAPSGRTVGGVIGPPDWIASAEYLLTDRLPGSRGIPGDPDRVRWLWRAIENAQGPERVRETVDAGLERGLVTVFLKDANFVDTARLMRALRAYEREHLSPVNIRLDFAGDVAVSQALIDAIVRSQMSSLLASLLGILAMTALLFRSLRWGLVCMVPATFAVAATFAVMGWASIPLGVATSMFAGMVLGVGVDFAIHLVARHRLAVAGGLSAEAAVADSLATTAPAIVVNGLAVALGFGLLVLSRVPANARLGEITVVSLLSCLAATLLVIPTLMRISSRRGSPAASRD